MSTGWPEDSNELKKINQKKDDELDEERLNGRLKKYRIELTDTGKEFLHSLNPVSRDIWKRRIAKGRMSKEHAELFIEMLEWYKKEKAKIKFTEEPIA